MHPHHAPALESDERKSLAEAIRTACRQAAMEAYEDAGIRGLCAEGAWECAMGAIQSLDLDAVIDRAAARSIPE